MPFQPGANLNTVAFGNRPENVEVPHIDVRAPALTDVNFPIGKWWLYTGNSLWYLLSLSSAGGVLTPNWIQIAAGSGDILSVLGTTNQITATTTAGVVTLTIPSTFIAPGSIASTTTLTGGTGITATTGNIVASAGNITTTVGSITSATSLTATLGNITATNGNIVKGTAGNKDVYTSLATTTAAGANSAGTVTLVGGTATIATTSVTAASKIRMTRQGVGATGANPLGLLSVGTITAATSFIINAWSSTSATALATTDVSSIFWEIVN